MLLALAQVLPRVRDTGRGVRVDLGSFSGPG